MALTRTPKGQEVRLWNPSPGTAAANGHAREAQGQIAQERSETMKKARASNSPPLGKGGLGGSSESTPQSGKRTNSDDRGVEDSPESFCRV